MMGQRIIVFSQKHKRAVRATMEKVFQFVIKLTAIKPLLDDSGLPAATRII